jgi:hypothetical protein
MRSSHEPAPGCTLRMKQSSSFPVAHSVNCHTRKDMQQMHETNQTHGQLSPRTDRSSCNERKPSHAKKTKEIKLTPYVDNHQVNTPTAFSGLLLASGLHQQLSMAAAAAAAIQRKLPSRSIHDTFSNFSSVSHAQMVVSPHLECQRYSKLRDSKSCFQSHTPFTFLLSCILLVAKQIKPPRSPNKLGQSPTRM